MSDSGTFGVKSRTTIQNILMSQYLSILILILLQISRGTFCNQDSCSKSNGSQATDRDVPQKSLVKRGP